MTAPVRPLLLAILLAVAAAPAALGATRTARFRGLVERVDAGRLEIRRAGGSTLTVRIGPGTRVYAVTAATLRSIKPESYVSVLVTPGPEGGRATAVTLYAPSERGFEAGTRPWDAAPGATLTAGWVADLRGEAPLRLTLTYRGGEASFAVPRDTPVTQVAPGEKASLEPGAAVTVFTRSEPDGALDAAAILVGRQGAVPGL